MPLAPAPHVRLSGIETLRGVAAAAVVFSHAARHVDLATGAPGLIAVFQAGHAGVDLFFVISGFIILHVHRADLGYAGRLWRYLGRRFKRVYPLYWIALGLTVAMSLAGGHPPPPASRMLTAVGLLPTVEEPVLGIAWTLQFEVVFYAVYSGLIVSRVAGSVLMGAWLAAIAAGCAGVVPAGVPSPLCGIYGLEFFMGMMAAFLLARRSVPGAPCAAVGVALFAAAYGAECAGVMDGYGNWARLAYGGPAALLVLGLALAEQVRVAQAPRWMRVLGGASYSIYLFQFVFIGVLWQALLRSGLAQALAAPVLFALLSGGALAGGVLASMTVEKPLLRALQGTRGHVGARSA